MKTLVPAMFTGGILGAFSVVLYSSIWLTRQESAQTTCLDYPTLGDPNKHAENMLDNELPQNSSLQDHKNNLIPHNTNINQYPNHNDPCQEEMARIFQRNDCFRSNFYNRQHACSVAAPLHLYAWYNGQGFGRIMHHTIDTCIFAAVLERPCVIDLDIRDKYYTWRSFINSGTYNWDLKILASSSAKHNISDAYQRLPHAASDEWTAASKLPNYPNVLPMVWHQEWKNPVTEHLKYWHGDNPQTRHKILLSPNFGFSWWKQGHYRTEIEKKGGGCKLNHLRTLLQNAMYAPTSLAMELFRERRSAFFSGIYNTANNNNKEKIPQIYGAIHLRTVKSDLQKTYYDNDATVELLRACINTVAPDIPIWWLVSDNRTAAEYMQARIDKVHTDYHMTESSLSHQVRFNSKNKKINLHSGFQMKQKFGHENMAPSIEDFMVLHESTVAIITHGAYGETGARGNGKIRIDGCGPGKQDDIFKAFRKPKLS